MATGVRAQSGRWKCSLFESRRELESQRRQLFEANQIKLDVREYICEADWGWKITFIKNGMQEVAEKLKDWKDAAVRKEILTNNADWKNVLRSTRSGITNSESILLRFWLIEQLSQYHVPHQALITSSSMKPSCEFGMLRNTRDDMGVPGNVFDCYSLHHAAFIGTCAQGMTNPSHLSSKMHLQKFPDQTKFQSWIVNFRAAVCARAE